jgi:hypothetical protein
MSDVVKADIVVIVHALYVAFVVLGQFLILLFGPFRLRWPRNFTFRTLHLLAIAFVAGEAIMGVECPLTRWERDWRGGNLNDVSQSCLAARLANRALWYDVGREDQDLWFKRGHITFAALVLVTFVLVPPHWPWRKKRPAAPPIVSLQAPPHPLQCNGAREMR